MTAQASGGSPSSQPKEPIQARPKIGLLGARGRMGQEVSGLLATGAPFHARGELVASVDQGESLEPLLGADVVIDFSSPEAMLALLARLTSVNAATALPALVVGSTGWTNDGRAALRAAAERTPILMSANFSTGVLLVLEMLKQYSPLFEKFGYTPVIVEAHHSHKKDAPSGTAISLQRAISPAGPGNVQTHAIRVGEVIGDHAVTFYGAADQIAVSHRAENRSIFARGAVDVALWLAGRRGGDGALRGLLGMDAYFKEQFAKAGSRS